MQYAMRLGSSALATFGLLVGATPTAPDVRSANVSWAERTIQRPGARSLDAWIDSVRGQHTIPAMGAIVFRADTVLALGIAGVRRSSSTAPVEERDRFQLGSNTKAITATVLATLVEEGKLTWTTTLAEVFPER
jgi:CubicO group peptidase (beta-lactamase class C family)